MEAYASFYGLLDISPQASQSEIEAAYRQQMQDLREHIARGEAPDNELFERIDTAFRTLRDPQLRAAYDAGLQATEAELPAHEVRFAFSGSGGEYFRIWIVNLLLSILTLGIYSAWAKVRREQYFHRNTLLDGSGFDYHATPLAILKGRLIALLLIGGLSISSEISMALYGLFVLVMLFVMPWLMVRAYRFRARNTSYRGLRFRFSGNYADALTVFVGYGLLAGITFYLMAPQWIRQMRLYVINHLHYGHGNFRAEVSTGQVYRLVAVPILCTIAALVVLVLLASSQSPLFLAALPLMLIGISLTVLPYFKMHFNNLFWSHTRLDQHAFHSSMRFGRYFRIVLKNWLLTLLTLGLYWPWARVNLVSYRASETRMSVRGSLDHFVAAASEQTSAIGDETAEMFDVDVGF